MKATGIVRRIDACVIIGAKIRSFETIGSMLVLLNKIAKINYENSAVNDFNIMINRLKPC